LFDLPQLRPYRAYLSAQDSEQSDSERSIAFTSATMNPE